MKAAIAQLDAAKHTGERNIGIDALRILAMFMVVLLHVLGQGGVLQAGGEVTLSYSLPWLLECMAYCAVNCYALITGYVCIQSKHKYKRIISLWFQVFFYTVLLTAVVAVVRPGTIGKEDVLNAFFPLLSKQYWYFTQYAGLFFLMPFLNKLLLGISKRQFQGLVLTLFILLSVMPCIINRDLFVTGSGYSMLWLGAIYVFGAYVKLYGHHLVYTKAMCLAGYFFSILVIWGGVLLQGAGIWSAGKCFLKYTSPFMVIAAVCLLLFFLKCQFRRPAAKKTIRFFAPISFGVFLIHTNGLLYHRELNAAFTVFRDYPVGLTLLFSLLSAVGIYLVCALLDFGRLKLFQLLKIDRLSQKIVDSVGATSAKLFAFTDKTLK